MKVIELERKKKVGVGIACAALVVLAIGVALAVPGCTGNGDSASSNNTVEAKIDADGGEKGEVGASGNPVAADDNLTDAGVGGTDNPTEKQGTGSSANDTNNNASSSRSSSGSKSSLNSKSPSSPGDSSSPSTPQKRRIPNCRQVWVEDSVAWDEKVPICGQREISVCNVCGENITGNETAHSKQHMLAGEGSGHHNETVSDIIDHDTVHHDATGHYETVESSGHWE